ncbi:hypothetical protein ELE36_14740 [Pseudolysobacter antarcticus]|uniref:Uncharacterized protein n=1 Tax=Pseudolysobacter antarcticus TaxID=2511995 RepID=A0A411HM88_9GAMM|nr:hypothetical protein [Pseudolysobacter antarcticus]QBB71510.1 hypothetical protein ELE36_14740 [Pseudolysobacter antarcticus]
MAKKPKIQRDPASPETTKNASASPANTSSQSTSATAFGWNGFLRERIAGVLSAPIIGLLAALILSFAGIFLAVAWQVGPQREIAHRQYEKYTAHATGKIVESWVAVDWNIADMPQDSINWQGYALASPCAVIEFDGDWGAAMRRAFCGARLPFHDEYALHNLSLLRPGVPFAWARDDNDFVVPEIRLSQTSLDWLATHAPYSTFNLSRPLPQTALEALQRQYDRPLDAALVGWTRSAPDIPLVFDPQHPLDAVPLAYVEAQMAESPFWIITIIIGGVGLFVWLEGMRLLVGNLSRGLGLMLALVPLIALPWWGENFPRFISHLNAQVGQMVGAFLSDVDGSTRLLVTDREHAPMVNAQRLIWTAKQTMYADTFGRMHFTAPTSLPLPDDLALKLLSETVTTQMRALNVGEQAAMYARLQRDKENDRLGVDLLFFTAAREVLLDTHADPALYQSARRFLVAALTAPSEPRYSVVMPPQQTAEIFCSLTDIPVGVIANMPSWKGCDRRTR